MERKQTSVSCLVLFCAKWLQVVSLTVDFLVVGSTKGRKMWNSFKIQVVHHAIQLGDFMEAKPNIEWVENTIYDPCQIGC